MLFRSTILRVYVKRIRMGLKTHLYPNMGNDLVSETNNRALESNPRRSTVGDLCLISGIVFPRWI